LNAVINKGLWGLIPQTELLATLMMWY
jgi:hypothetical protein